MPSPRASEARARSSAAAVSDVISSSSTGRGGQRTRQRAGHHLEQVNDGGELASIELIEELVRLLFFVGG
jgi:hypothetical protein